MSIILRELYSIVHTSSKCCLVLAASVMPYEYSNTGSKSFLFLNSSVSLALEKIKKFYQESFIPVFVVTDLSSGLFTSFEAFNGCNFLFAPKSNSVVETISFAIKKLSQFEEIIINPIQVLPHALLPESSISLSDQEIRKGDWSAVQLNQGSIPLFLFRDDLPAQGMQAHAFTGRISCKVSHLISAISACLPHESSDLGYLAFYLHSLYDYSFFHEKWLDLVHDNLKVSSRLNSITSRAFHNLSFDNDLKIIRKSFQRIEESQLILEYYSQMPGRVKHFFPTFINSSSNQKANICEFEYVPFPTLAELFLHEDLSHVSWENIVHQLHFVFSQFYGRSIESAYVATDGMYMNKTLNRQKRLEHLLSSKGRLEELSHIYNNEFTVNDINFPPLARAFEKSIESLRSITHDDIFFGHGDFCFGNILIDPYSQVVKLVDPRIANDLGNQSIGAVSRGYDMAKLAHSFSGLYDSIISNMFHLNFSQSSCMSLQIYSPPKHEFIEKTFNNAFADYITPDTRSLLASLFLSMIPLHTEDPNRTLALASVGSLLLWTDNQPAKFFK